MNRGEKHFTGEIASTLWTVGADAWFDDRFGSVIDLLGKHAAMSGEAVYRPLMDYELVWLFF